jgi:phage gp36-like protein
MGLYATVTSISNYLPDFLDGNTTTSDKLGTDVFSACIGKAEAMFNAAIAQRYSLPFNANLIPPLARELCFDMAAYFAIRGFSSRDWPNRNEMLDDFKLAFDELDKLAKGEKYLCDTQGTLISRNTDMMATNREGQGAVFDLDDPKEWEVSQNRLDEIDDARN